MINNMAIKSKLLLLLGIVLSGLIIMGIVGSSTISSIKDGGTYLYEKRTVALGTMGRIAMHFDNMRAASFRTQMFNDPSKWNENKPKFNHNFSSNFGNFQIHNNIFIQFIKEVKKTSIKGILLENKDIPVDTLKDIANLPSKEVLIAKLLGTMKAPVTNLAFALNGVAVKLVGTLEAIRKQKEGAA